MKKIVLVLLSLIGASACAEAPIAVVVTCQTQPGAKRPDFLALAGNCDQKQAACDDYKNDPYYGPATAVACEPHTNLKKLQAVLTKEFKKGRRFPGSPGSITLCKTKHEGNIFAMAGESCDPAEQKKNCDKYGKDIAEPTSCAMYTSQDWLEAEANKNPVRYGIECQITGSAVPYRVAVPDCSPTLKKFLCDPESGKILACNKWDNPLALKQWAEAIPMTGFVSCRLKDMPLKTVSHIPARDCTPQSQLDACSHWGTPAGCEIKDIEALRQEMLKKQGS